MSVEETVSIICPYCGEPFDLVVDCSVPVQEYIEDCSVCCQPVNLGIDASDPDNIRIAAHTDNE